LYIFNNTFENNTAISEGGAIAINDDKRMENNQNISNNRFYKNKADIGGSIFTKNIALYKDQS